MSPLADPDAGAAAVDVPLDEATPAGQRIRHERQDSLLMVVALDRAADPRPACERLTDALDPVVTSSGIFSAGQAGEPQGEDGGVIWCGDPDLLLAHDGELGRLALEGQTPHPAWCVDLMAEVRDGRLTTLEIDGEALDVLLARAGQPGDATAIASAIGLAVEDAARVLEPVLRRVLGT